MDSEKGLKYCYELALQAITGPPPVLPPGEGASSLTWAEWHDARRQCQGQLATLSHNHDNTMNITTAWFGGPAQEVTIEVIVHWMGDTVVRERVSLEYFIGD